MVESALVIGLGSIGKRHLRVLNSLGIEVSAVSKHQRKGTNRYNTLADAFASKQYGYVVIANETPNHWSTYLRLKNYCAEDTIILVEKPIFHEIPSQRLIFKNTFVGYNLRYLNALQELKKITSEYDPLSAQIYAGQYLPDWRPNVDYRISYSASSTKCGGVLRDLSHELDYSQWLFGQPLASTAIHGKWSSLDISSEDTAIVLAQMERCNALSISLNYTDRRVRRELHVQCDKLSIFCDVLSNTLTVNDKKYQYGVTVDDTYRLMHLDIIGKQQFVCSANEGFDTLRWIHQLDESNFPNKAK